MAMFIMYDDKVVYTHDNHLGYDVPKTWLEAGAYKVIRKFDDERILIEVKEKPRRITLIDKSLGTINDEL